MQDRDKALCERLRKALGFAEQALTVAANSMAAPEDHALYSRALRAARAALATPEAE